MSYDALHNIVRKTQTVNQQNISIDGLWKSNYDLTYEYAANPQQISTIADSSSCGMNDRNLVKTTSTKAYTYDANGNLLEVRSQATTGNSDRRRLLWDEENRLLAVNDNGYVSNYCYDASGERTVKCSGVGVGVYVNGGYSGGLTSTGGYSVYVSPYAVVTNGATLSKHFYVGTQRVATKLCDAAALNAQSETKAGGKDFTAATDALNSALAVRYDSLGVKYTATTVVSSAATTASTTESLYYYHPDHLGSSSLVTDGSGAVTQHLEYIPFGEVFVEERNNQWNTPYKFNAKEQDEETGLYYYGARYYDPRTSVWLSVDPLAEKYPGVSSYVYCLSNPVKFVDPDGRQVGGGEETGGVPSKINKSNGVPTSSQSSIRPVVPDKLAPVKRVNPQPAKKPDSSQIPKSPQANKTESPKGKVDASVTLKKHNKLESPIFGVDFYTTDKITEGTSNVNITKDFETELPESETTFGANGTTQSTLNSDGSGGSVGFMGVSIGMERNLLTIDFQQSIPNSTAGFGVTIKIDPRMLMAVPSMAGAGCMVGSPIPSVGSSLPVPAFGF